MSEIVVPRDAPGAEVTTDFLSRLALHPEMKPDNLAAAINGWITVQEWMLERDAKLRRQTALEAYISAKASMQAEMRAVERGTVNPHTRSRFANFGDLWSACAPVWGRHGFAVDFDVIEHGDQIEVVGYLSHAAGHVQEFHSYKAPPDTAGLRGGGNKTLIQGKQSTATYIQRNLLCRMVGIATVDDPADDDGAGPAPAHGREPPPRPGPSDDPLAAGEVGAVAKLIGDILAQPDEAALEALVERVRAAVDAAPPQAQQEVGRALRQARAAMRRQREPEREPEPFQHVMIHADGTSDGELLGLDAWVSEFLELWDGSAKRPDDQQALLEHNADPLAAARRLGAASRLVDVVPRGEASPPALPFNDAAPFSPDDDPVEQWVQQQMAFLAPLTKTPEDFAKLQVRTRDITPRMRELAETHPDAHRRIKYAYETKWAALRPEKDPS